MEAIIEQATGLAKTADEAGRRKLVDGLRDLSISLETTHESAQRILYSQVQLAFVRIGCDLQLFGMLADSESPLSVSDISARTKVAPKLLGRMLRYMASIRLIAEPDKDLFAANGVTRTFANPGFAGGIYHMFDYVQPAIQRLPEFLKEHGYADVESADKTVLAAAWNTDMPIFAHYQTKPELFGHFNKFMGVQRFGMPAWTDVYPYREVAAEGLAPERAFFVDVGGGFGHQAIALREKLPEAEVPNRIVVEDLPIAIEHAVPHQGVDFVVQDFFQQQKITGARLYYMRNVIHDWPNDRATDILTNIKAAMSPDSVLLIDEMCLPASNVHWQAAQVDMTMMYCMSAVERTEEQWRDLIPKAGLKINKIYRYTESLRDSVIECSLA